MPYQAYKATVTLPDEDAVIVETQRERLFQRVWDLLVYDPTIEHATIQFDAVYVEEVTNGVASS